MWVFHCLAQFSLRGKQPRDFLRDFATLNAQSTLHGARPGPKHAPWCTGEPSACPAAESARKTRTLEKSVQMSQKKKHIVHSSDISGLLSAESVFGLDGSRGSLRLSSLIQNGIMIGSSSTTMAYFLEVLVRRINYIPGTYIAYNFFQRK